MKSKWLIGGLAASVVLNLALIGFLIGAASGPPPWARRGFDPTDGLARLMFFLGEDRRKALFGDGRTRREIGASLKDMRRAQRAIGEALTAEPFDRTALATALDQFRDQFEAHQTLSHAVLVDIAERMTPEERRRFVKRRFAGKRPKMRPPPQGLPP